MKSYLKYILILAVFLVLPTVSEAANFYWVGGCSTANWSCDDGATTNWSLSDGGAQHTDIPGATDDVFFTVTDASNSTLSANITINSLDMTGYTGVLTHNASVTLTHDSSGVFTLCAAVGCYVLGSVTSSALSFTSTSGTTLITTAGKNFGNVTFNGSGGTWQLQDSFSATSGTISVTTGTFDTNNQSVTALVFSPDGAGVRTITLGSSAIALSGTANAWFSTTVTNLTVTANTAVVTVSGSTAVFRSVAKDWNGLSLVFTGTTPTLLAGASTFLNVTRTGTTAKTDTFIFSGTGPIITGTFTVNGDSSVNRILVTSETLGTARTITAATVTITNADFRDITGAGAGSWDLSAITGLSGDAGGNSGITFTTAATQYWTGNTGTWSVANQWCLTSAGCADNTGDGRVPLPQDDVVFNNGSFNSTSQTVTGDMPRAGKSIDWSAYNEGQTPSWTKNHTDYYGSFTLISGMNITNSGINEAFYGRGSFTLTSAGKTLHNPTFAMVGGTMTLQDAITIAGGYSVTDGTLNLNNFNATGATGLVSVGTRTRSVIMGSGTWTVTGTGTVWNVVSTGLTLTPNTSTVVLSNTSSTAKTFAGGGLTYNDVTITGQNVTFTGSNTFNTLALSTAGYLYGIGTKFTTATTQTVTNFTVNSTTTLDRVMASSTAATNATLTKSGGGTICLDYINIKDMTGSPASTWYAGTNSTDGGDNTNWTFTACPAVGSVGPKGVIYSGSIYSGSI